MYSKYEIISTLNPRSGQSPPASANVAYITHHCMEKNVQVNFRIPARLKERAWKKAEQIGTDPSSLMRLFWTQFVEKDNVVHIQCTVDMDQIFDEGVKSYFMSKKGRGKTKKIGLMIESL